MSHPVCVIAAQLRHKGYFYCRKITVYRFLVYKAKCFNHTISNSCYKNLLCSKITDYYLLSATILLSCIPLVNLN